MRCNNQVCLACEVEREEIRMSMAEMASRVMTFGYSMVELSTVVDEDSGHFALVIDDVSLEDDMTEAMA